MDNPITLPRSEDTALLKQDPYVSDAGKLSEIVEKLFDEEDVFTQRVREVVIGSQSRRKFEDNAETDTDGIIDILGNRLDSDDLECILRNLNQLQTFTYDERTCGIPFQTNMCMAVGVSTCLYPQTS